MKYGIPKTGKEVWSMIQRIFWAVLAGVFVFTVFLYLVSRIVSPVITEKSTIRNLLIVLLFLSSAGLSYSVYIFRKKMAMAKQAGLSLLEKLNNYKSALILFLAFNEVPAIAAMLFYFLTGNRLFIIITGILWLHMLLKRPDKLKIFNELELNSSEQSELI